MERASLAVFDIDGTLIRHYGRVEDDAYLAGLESALGFRDVDPDWTKYPHVTDTGIVTHLFVARRNRHPTTSEMARFQDAYRRAFMERAGPEDGREIGGARAFVEELRADPGWGVALATGNCLRMATFKLNRADVPCLDLPIATADDAISRADLVRLAIARACRHYDVDAFRHVVSIGDAPWDLETARELGLPFVAVGSRCGGPLGAHTITDYLDRSRVLQLLTRAVCW